MKTTIVTIAIALSTVFGLSNSTFAATTGNKTESTILSDVSKINKIEVHGNVELYLSSGSTDKVKVYNSYYAESALVQDQNGVLNITSYNEKKLVVWVTADQLQELSVYDNAEVKSFGKLSTIDLDVKLYNNASAKLDVDAFTAKVLLNNSAKADITGTANEASVKIDQAASANTVSFAAEHLTKTTTIETFGGLEMPELSIL